MLKSHVACINDFDADVLLSRPVGEQACWQDMAESVLDPYHRPLVVLEVQNDGAVLQCV